VEGREGLGEENDGTFLRRGCRVQGRGVRGEGGHSHQGAQSSENKRGASVDQNKSRREKDPLTHHGCTRSREQDLKNASLLLSSRRIRGLVDQDFLGEKRITYLNTDALLHLMAGYPDKRR